MPFQHYKHLIRLGWPLLIILFASSFMPELRAIEIIRNKKGEINKLHFEGYQGDKLAIKL